MVNFCNLPGKRNIFTNTNRKDLRENFEHTMALFQEKGVIFKPTPKPIDSRISLETISPIDNKQLFEPRIYKKKVPTFMAENKSDGLMPEIRS